MAMKRPGFVGSPTANDAAIRGDDKFMKWKDGETKLLRFLPAPKEDNILFYPVTNHFMTNQDGKKVSVSSNRKHGNDEVGHRDLIQDVVDYMLGEDKKDKFALEIRAQTRHHAQVLEGVVTKDGVKYSAPKFPAFSATTANKINTIFKSQEKMNQPLAYDPDKGQSLMITRAGDGYDTEYTVERTSQIETLDSIRPTWVDEFKDDIYAAVGLNVLPLEEQEALLRSTGPRMDWASIFEAVGYEPAE